MAPHSDLAATGQLSSALSSPGSQLGETGEGEDRGAGAESGRDSQVLCQRDQLHHQTPPGPDGPVH